jgi:hypothetical protein
MQVILEKFDGSQVSIEVTEDMKVGDLVSIAQNTLKDQEINEKHMLF